MSENNELFPFPTLGEPAQSNDSRTGSELPAFPGSEDHKTEEPPLSSDELRKIRHLLLTGDKAAAPAVKPEPELPPMPRPNPAAAAAAAPTEAMPANSLQQQLIAHWESLHLTEACEVEARNQFCDIIRSVSDNRVMVKVWGAANSLLPIKSNLRHGTPEQKLFTLITLGERFLQSLTGVSFGERRRLLKTTARYLSEVSESYSFIQMEGETFNPQYHERAPGSLPSGKTVREMHGFLVTARSSNQVVKTGLVLT
ncbi:MAG: hypothetical protein CVV42_04630 [Candidatus Riflebacteria bacterium HGW-Riflebacteria-2]|jgi:hypothetical protein|nr:MAG: hypothetical protein CVV42_04630 [Candidatus Riflebacteria bacterium HGW-Riflebacteria-2]